MSELHGSPANAPDVAPARRSVAGNPLLDAFRNAMTVRTDIDDARTEAIARYGFAIPSDEAIGAIQRCSPEGVIEVGAGTGYWASLLQRRGVDVVAFDIEPAPSPQNTWFAGTRPWHPVHHGDHDIVRAHSERTLLIVWPTKNETWAATALERYHDAGGQRVVFVGEGPGGRSGDATFHAMLGELSSCVQCVYGATREPCICGVGARWHRIETIKLPHWPGFFDDLQIYARESPVEGGRRRRRSRSRRTALG